MTTDSALVRADVFRLLSNGVYILSAYDGESLHAATVTWVTQVSFQPPLILVALRRNSHLGAAIHRAHRYAVNILEKGQEKVAETFFSHQVGTPQADALAGFPVRTSQTKCPLLTAAIAWMECRLADELATSGDHTLVLGEVTATGIRRQGTPLLLGDTPWSYGRLVGE
jgi:flavin reductase (DIM6/NTAB) family NADH-FMN oxidoreductase RutF